MYVLLEYIICLVQVANGAAAGWGKDSRLLPSSRNHFLAGLIIKGTVLMLMSKFTLYVTEELISSL
jgi:hypothetical protein